MATTLAQIEKELSSTADLPEINPGDTVKVYVRIIEGAKTRTQIFQGTVIAMKHSGVRSTITVRKISNGVGVERIFPVHSPVVEKIEIKSRHRVRRAKLYYLRSLHGKNARLIEIRN
jgi:large subunit ribosomal protein L19